MSGAVVVVVVVLLLPRVLDALIRYVGVLRGPRKDPVRRWVGRDRELVADIVADWMAERIGMATFEARVEERLRSGKLPPRKPPVILCGCGQCGRAPRRGLPTPQDALGAMHEKPMFPMPAAFDPMESVRE